MTTHTHLIAPSPGTITGITQEKERRKDDIKGAQSRKGNN